MKKSSDIFPTTTSEELWVLFDVHPLNKEWIDHIECKELDFYRHYKHTDLIPSRYDLVNGI